MELKTLGALLDPACIQPLLRLARVVGAIPLKTVAALLQEFFRMKLRLRFEHGTRLAYCTVRVADRDAALSPKLLPTRRAAAWERFLALCREFRDDRRFSCVTWGPWLPRPACTDVTEMFLSRGARGGPGHVYRLVPLLRQGDYEELGRLRGECEGELADLIDRQQQLRLDRGSLVHSMSEHGWFPNAQSQLVAAYRLVKARVARSVTPEAAHWAGPLGLWAARDGAGRLGAL